MSDRREAVEAAQLKHGSHSAVVARNLPLVYHVIKKYCRPYLRDSKLDVGDFASWGTLGMYEAAARYDPKRGKFSGYAVPYILGYIKNGMSRHLRREIWLLTESNRWHASQGREIHRVKEIAIDGLSDSMRHWLMGVDGTNETQDEIVERLHTERLACRLCRELPDMDRLVVHKLFYEGKSQQEIADELGCARSTVSWYWARTKKMAREMFEGEEI